MAETGELSASRSGFERISAVILAAGQSRRMGQPKLVMPWGSTTVIQTVVSTLIDVGLTHLVVVTGAARDAVEQVLIGQPVTFVHNDLYQHSEMLTSLKVGLQAVPKTIKGILVVLGDQPMIQHTVIQTLAEAYTAGKGPLIIPSFQMRRGHPWLVDRGLWPTLLAMPDNLTMQDFIQDHADMIQYINVDTPSILKDLDTPDDYRQMHS